MKTINEEEFIEICKNSQTAAKGILKGAEYFAFLGGDDNA